MKKVDDYFVYIYEGQWINNRFVSVPFEHRLQCKSLKCLLRACLNKKTYTTQEKILDKIRSRREVEV